MYAKVTDSHQYLEFNSDHPTHITHNLPYGLALRIIRICSTDLHRRLRLEDLRLQLLKRGYPLRIINRSFVRATSISRQDLLSNTQSNTNNKIPLITYFHQGLQSKLKSIFIHNLPVLRNSRIMTDILNHHKPVVAFRRNPSLRDLLIKSCYTSKPPPSKGFYPCNTTNCLLHQYIPHPQIKTLSPWGQSANISGHIDCNTVSVIYLISCAACDAKYVGETGRTLKERIKEHLADIRYARPTPVAIHFCSGGCNITDFSFFGFERIASGNFIHRRLREAYWILKFDSVNRGINTSVSSELLNLASSL